MQLLQPPAEREQVRHRLLLGQLWCHKVTVEVDRTGHRQQELGLSLRIDTVDRQVSFRHDRAVADEDGSVDLHTPA
mgnify:CR=1 FL=1